MKAMTSGLGLLREHLAQREIEKLESERSGPTLVSYAVARVNEADGLESKLTELAASVEREPRRTMALVETFLRRTSSPKLLAGDLRALRKSRGKRPTVAALSERVAVEKARLELAAEVALAIAGKRLVGRSIEPPTFEALVALALRKGRPSRRIEALKALGACVIERSQKDTLVSLCRELTESTEHRWVQPAAIELLASIDRETAIPLARRRLEDPRPGDDFLVRERIVDFAGVRGADWAGIVELATKDPSEHVRLTAARLSMNDRRLAHVAMADVSTKVRARALLALTTRPTETALPILIATLDASKESLVVETAARCMTTLAREQRLYSVADATSALSRASARADVPERTRVAVIEELSAVSVLADPMLRPAYDLLADALRDVPTSGAVEVAGSPIDALDDESIGRILSVLAQGDFGLSAERRGRTLIIYRGERSASRPWRILFEARRPLPSKRQAYDHGKGRIFRGSLRAPPRKLSELTATHVPGERVLVSKRGDWGRHLPLVDDLLAAPLFSTKAAVLYGPSGRTSIEPPKSLVARLAAQLTLTIGYARFSEQRRRALESDEPAIQRGYADEIARRAGFTMRFEPYEVARAVPAPAELPRAFAGLAMGLVASPLAQIVDGVSDLGHFALRAEGNRLPHVAAYAAIALVGMLARSIVVRGAIELDRASIPLTIGGWGTRGKSGTERLKAGLFQGLGYEVLVKTTGCEAMFIHALPGLRAQEVFIYRPYDKATIWEQRDLLRLGRRFGVRAFLWECMALQPDLVTLLQQQWMHDDYSTITNAYPDHEDVQGPAGQDVAEVISEFVPKRGHLLTTEDEMLPILRERAKERNTTFEAVGSLDADLIADDILARFPYHEHPKNIALVCALARRLGVPEAVALVEMADNVVPDLGVLKTYPRVAHAGRTIAFTNGMSANERTGALSNWTRMGFDRHDPDEEPKRWIVTVCNNRADRVARSEVFARFLVDDIAAHQHVLIGTNVSGLMGMLREALERFVEERSPIKDLGGSVSERQATMETRIARVFSRLKIGAATAESVSAELAALGLPSIAHAAVAQALTPAVGESLAAARAAVTAAIPAGGFSEEAWPFVVATIVRRRVAEGVRRLARSEGLTNPKRVDAVFRETYLALFLDRVIAIDDPAMTGDRLVDRLLESAPPGAQIDVMGIQNIKGTGLDFVYRWVSLDSVSRSLTKVLSSATAEREEGLKELLAHDDYGLVSAVEAVRVLDAEHVSILAEHRRLYETVLARLRGVVAQRSAALRARRAEGLADRARAVVGATFDYLDSIRRKSAAERVLDELVAGRISHAAAAIEMRTILARSKGAWALKSG